VQKKKCTHTNISYHVQDSSDHISSVKIFAIRDIGQLRIANGLDVIPVETVFVEDIRVYDPMLQAIGHEVDARISGRFGEIGTIGEVRSSWELAEVSDSNAIPAMEHLEVGGNVRDPAPQTVHH